MSEADIVINGTPLHRSQAMAVRVALTSYHDEMSNPDFLGPDEMGRQMTAAYRARIGEVLKLLLPALTEKDKDDGRTPSPATSE